MTQSLRFKIKVYFKKLRKGTPLLVGFIFFLSQGFSQSLNNSDSLIESLKHNISISDSLKLEVLRTIFIDHTLNSETRLKYANEAFEIASRTNSTLWQYRSVINIGHIYRKQGDLENALRALFQSIDYAKELSDSRREAIACTAIGDVYATENNHKNALTYYNLGIIKFREINDSINLAKNLLNTGDFYLTIHKLDSALIYFEESGKIFDLKNYKIGKAYNLGNIGLVYAEQGKHVQAEQNIIKATKILEELGDNYPIAVYNTYMADIYKAKGDMPRALAYAQHSYDLAMADGLKEQIRDASQKLSELYEANQDYKKAFLFQKKYLAYRDSINNEETVRKMADLRTEYEVSQKQIEVDLLQQEQKTSKLIRVGLLVLLVLIGALAFIYIKRNKEKRLSNALLTNQKQQLKIQHDELDVLNTTKDRFFSIISHDLRGPVSSFKGLTAIMKMSLKDKKFEELPKMADMLDKASNQLSSLLDNLLAWAVNQQGEFPYAPKNTPIKLVVNVVLQGFKSTAELKDIKIIEDVGEDLVVWADEESLKTIIRNLLNNALKFTPKGGEIKILASKKDNYIHLKISDTGIGIPKEKFDQLFALNELKSTPGTDGEKGLGLGLRLVYEFTKMNKGEITATSEEGVGTEFDILLPLAKA